MIIYIYLPGDHINTSFELLHAFIYTYLSLNYLMLPFEVPMMIFVFTPYFDKNMLYLVWKHKHAFLSPSIWIYLFIKHWHAQIHQEINEISEFSGLASLDPTQPAWVASQITLYLHATLSKTRSHAAPTAQMTPWSHPPVPSPLLSVLSPMHLCLCRVQVPLLLASRGEQCLTHSSTRVHLIIGFC